MGYVDNCAVAVGQLLTDLSSVENITPPGVNAKYSTPDQVMIKVPETGIVPKKSIGPKSLNAPTISKVTEHRGLRMPRATTVAYCFECKMLMNAVDHYKSVAVYIYGYWCGLWCFLCDISCGFKLFFICVNMCKPML